MREYELMKLEQMRPRLLLGGAVLGAVVGVMGAMLLLQRARQEERAPQITTMEGVKMGVWIFGLLRSIMTM